jgi:hypothetical protein
MNTESTIAEHMQAESVTLGPVSILDAVSILESVTAELEVLRSQHNAAGRLVELHGALFLYALDGRAELIQNQGIPLGGRQLLELRVAFAARRLAGRDRGESAASAALARAAQRIEELIHLIDPELAVNAA